MLTKLIIPTKINVGFQTRADTYTGKLAYVVYTDAKGVLRKEKSWQSWRDQKIDPVEFDNVPTSGFVLNKKVGGYGGWNPRQTYVRIYDPRDFEFEITVANLLFILEECSAIKGKGLEGEFVYSWDGTEVVLLPVTSQNYQKSAEFTNLQTKKLTKTDIKPGCVYVNKDTQQVMYLGRLDWYELESEYHGHTSSRHLKRSKQHVFVSVDGKSTYWIQGGFTKLATRIGEDVSPLFADEYEKFTKSVNGSPPAKLVSSPNPVKFENDAGATLPYLNHYGFVKQGDQYYPARLTSRYDYGQRTYGWGGQSGYGYGLSNVATAPTLVYTLYQSPTPVAMTRDKAVRISQSNMPDKTLSRQQAEALEFVSVSIQNEHGTLIAI